MSRLPHGPAPEAPKRAKAESEDGLDDTVRPRLDAMGADPRRIHVITGIGDAEGLVTLQDLDVLGEAMSRIAPALAVVDPLQAHLGPNVEMGKSEQTRPVLAALSKLAERHGVACVIVRHLRKSGAEKALYRGLGSVDIPAAARSVLMVLRDPDDPAQRHLIPVKASLGPEGPGLLYRIEGGGLSWCGLSARGAEELLGPPKRGNGDADASEDDPSALESAERYLRVALAGGPRRASELYTEAVEAGIASRTLHRARAALDVVGAWEGRSRTWALPPGEEERQ